MDDMIERVARAICEADTMAPGSDAPIYKGMKPCKAWEGRTEMARAAIEAMREPTEEVCVVGDEAISDGLMRAQDGLPPKDADHASREVWQAMCDAALTSTESEASHDLDDGRQDAFRND